MLKDITPLLQKLASNSSLTTQEAREALNSVGDEDTITNPDVSDGLYFLALTFGVMAKGPTADELLGFVQSLGDRSVHWSPKLESADVTDLSGSGGDAINTFNVGTTASFVVAAGGVAVAKQATRAYTSLTGSSDVFRELGVDVFAETSPTSVEASLEKVGLAAFYTPAFSRGFKNRIDFLTKLKTIGLTYRTPWHLVSWVYSPIKMDTRLYGVYSPAYLRVLAELFVKLGYRRGMVVHGIDGLDEVSVVGPTMVAEYDEDGIREYQITPEDLGLKTASVSSIEGHDVESNKADFFRVLYGIDGGPKRDLVAANAGASLYLAGRAPTLRGGVELAISLIESGKSAAKLEEFVEHLRSVDRLREWRRKVGA